MKASFMDRGKYYRGLLVLIGRDRIVDPRERASMLWLGKMLDFDERFCEAAITDLLRNRYLSSEPILFDERLIAKCFLRDALRLALIDKELHAHELSWLKTVAQTNNITDEWLDKELQGLEKIRLTEAQPDSFEIRQYI
ncbi:MAG: hypothetical protein P8Y80_02140 [Acidobacteriota bacterium]|jgi:hypothetical protein